MPEDEDRHAAWETGSHGFFVAHDSDLEQDLGWLLDLQNAWIEVELGRLAVGVPELYLRCGFGALMGGMSTQKNR